MYAKKKKWEGLNMHEMQKDREEVSEKKIDKHNCMHAWWLSNVQQ